MQTKRLLLIVTILFATGLAKPVDASIAQPIKLIAMGSFSPSGSLSLVDQGSTYDLTMPPGTFTTTAFLGPTNTGMVLGDTISFSGITFTNYALTAVVPANTSLQFSTTQGTFSFTGVAGLFGPSPANFAYTTGDSFVYTIGNLTGSNSAFAPSTAVLGLFFNAQAYLANTGVLSIPNGQFPPSGPLGGQYEGAAWVLASISSVPEPTSACCWGLMAVGMLTYRRRWAR